MRRSILGSFSSYLLTKVAKSFTRCWKVTRKDGVILGFTTHTRDLTVDGVLYQMLGGLTTSAVKSSEGLSVDNLAVSAFLTAQSEGDILRGVYDGAMVEVFVVNYFNLGLGKLTEKVGFLGEVTRADGIFHAELRGLMDMLRTKIGRVYTAGCDARLGDARCKVPLTPVDGLITIPTSAKSFQSVAITGSPEHMYTSGTVVFLSGQNTGVTRDIRYQNNTDVVLFLAPPFPLMTGDAVSLTVGCDKTKYTCIHTFNNVLNFRGFDFVPTIEQVFDSPINLQPSLTLCAPADEAVGPGGTLFPFPGIQSDVVD